MTSLANIIKLTLKSGTEKRYKVLYEKKIAEQNPCNKAEMQRMANKMRENNDGWTARKEMHITEQ